jgi:hypothetical protein
MIRLKSLLTEQKQAALKTGATARGVTVANALKTKLGLKSFQAAALAGNFVEESGVRSDARQDMTGAGKYIPGTLKVDGKTGYSFAQWTAKSRQQALKDYALTQGVDVTKTPATSTVATNFVAHELNGTFANVLKKLKASKNLSAATNIILKQYEMPADQGPVALANRTASAQAILNSMTTTATTTNKTTGSNLVHDDAGNLVPKKQTSITDPSNPWTASWVRD